MGREAPRERRAHLFAVIEEMTRERSQGETETNPSRIAHLLEIAKLSRASYYRWLEPKRTERDDADLRDLIQRLALQRRHEGYRRLTQRLRHQGLVVNAKRVLRLMRADNLLSLRRKPFVPPTTDSRHKFRIVPNLARALEPTGLDQLWVADITYVRLAEGFVYLAVVVDAFSRKVVGWALDDHLEARLAIEALDMAIDARNPLPGVIHHSDRGVQYASGEYAGPPGSARLPTQHEPAGKSLGQRQGRKLHEDAEGRRGRRQDLSEPPGRPTTGRNLHRRCLQRRSPTLCPRLQIAHCLRGRNQKRWRI